MLAAPFELWRVSDFRELNGEGGLRYAARWNSAGHRVVYLAESAPGALLEVLVHLEVEDSELPHQYNLLKVNISARVQAERLLLPEGEAWKEDLATTRAIGDEWLQSGHSVLAEVPSAIIPGTRNYLMNPRHPGAAGVRVAEVISARFDQRLLRKKNP